ncbi:MULTISPECIES: chemotaxis protein CheW [unclassified Lysobacter]|uniref:chemotaxis protein CheW n=1 Tax=unclassified Lysobacter TaxID=2635362 RepID=UPI001BE4F287|nr:MULTISPECIES: chemotaxis protein CheW [unclassified Lysobacter]MBT2745879.1 chemotaxis protein CheW [Lysobacter sp. ISL-42]MBT2749562.1 chemotaxis protein CheW [Lysobacter sp. ISL-50]MBT2778794.1 chemotaxis protein CheW [Lysobacter sp. ISL-54]MBT2781389.1 chemotaxis protein CheW [Lysobacter sp. ISL-52]
MSNENQNSDSAGDASASVQTDIRGVLIQVGGARLLLPNATIAEVLSYAPPAPITGAPRWLLGQTRWRGWTLPLIAFGELSGLAREPGGLGSKVVVLKALSAASRLPYFALLTQGFPRLVTVAADSLTLEGREGDVLPHGVQARVRLNDDAALLPDLEAVEAMIGEALAQAA